MEDVEWPEEYIPQPIIDLIARFHALIDSRDPNASRELAEEVFAPDGQWIVNKRVMRGPYEIQKHRPSTATVLPRRHQLTKIFTCNSRGDDLLMTGTYKQVGSGNGSSGTPEGSGTYCARCIVDDCESDAPRIQYWQSWMDNPPFAAGIASTPRKEKTTPGSGVLDTIGGR